MFVVSEDDAATIRTAYAEGGELTAAVELRRLFPGLANNENTRPVPGPSPDGSRCPRCRRRNPHVGQAGPERADQV